MLYLGAGGPAVGWISRGEAERRLAPVGDGEWWVGKVLGLNSPGAVAVAARPDTLDQPVPPADPSLRTASGHHVVLELENGTSFARFSCNTLYVLDDTQPDRTRVQVRDPHDAWVVEGWVHGEITERGQAACPPRIVPAVEGELQEIPTGWLTFVPPRPPPELTGVVWRRPWRVRTGPCERWEMTPIAGGVKLTRDVTEARAIVHMRQTLTGGPVTWTRGSPSYETEWVEPPPGGGAASRPAVSGAEYPLTLLSGDAYGYRWVEAADIAGVHPRDVVRWHRTEQACEGR